MKGCIRSSIRRNLDTQGDAGSSMGGRHSIFDRKRKVKEIGSLRLSTRLNAAQAQEIKPRTTRCAVGVQLHASVGTSLSERAGYGTRSMLDQLRGTAKRTELHLVPLCSMQAFLCALIVCKIWIKTESRRKRSVQKQSNTVLDNAQVQQATSCDFRGARNGGSVCSQSDPCRSGLEINW